MSPVTSSEQQLQLLKSKDKGNSVLGLLHGGVYIYIYKNIIFYIKTVVQSVWLEEGGRDCWGGLNIEENL